MNDLDIREKNSEEVIWEHTQEVHDHSKLWANITKPFAWFIFTLTSFVIMTPFIIIAVSSIITKTNQMEVLMRWSTTVLAPIVGFGSAVVGYYFGTNGQSSKKSK